MMVSSPTPLQEHTNLPFTGAAAAPPRNKVVRRSSNSMPSAMKRIFAKSGGVAIHHDADRAVVAHDRPMINFREGIAVGHALRLRLIFLTAVRAGATIAADFQHVGIQWPSIRAVQSVT